MDKPLGRGDLFLVTLNATAPNLRFREARERLGLSPQEVAARSGVSSSAVWDIEEIDDDLTSCYSPRQLQQFCRVLAIHPVKLFADEISEPAVSAQDLARRIHEECHSRGVTLEQFENLVGWRLGACIKPAEKLLEDLTLDALQSVCRQLRIDWRRVLLGL